LPQVKVVLELLYILAFLRVFHVEFGNHEVLLPAADGLRDGFVALFQRCEQTGRFQNTTTSRLQPRQAQFHLPPMRQPLTRQPCPGPHPVRRAQQDRFHVCDRRPGHCYPPLGLIFQHTQLLPPLSDGIVGGGDSLCYRRQLS
jgi:hypothetical protein